MITVVTPCYNQAQYLAKAIESVLAQTVTEFEYLLLDDGSTDDTWDIMCQYAKQDDRIRAIRLPKQKTVGMVLNRSIREATGKYWVWCPADDVLFPHLLYQKREYAGGLMDFIIYSDWEIINHEGKRTGTKRLPMWSPVQFRKLVWEESPIGFTGIWIPTAVFDRVGVFPTNLRYSEDFEWMIRATIHGETFMGIPEVLYQKRVHANRNTSRNQERIVEQIPKIRNNLRLYRRLMERAARP